MAMVAITPMGLWDDEFPLANGVNSNMLIDAAGEKAAYVVSAPKAGTIDRVCFRTNTVTTGATVDVRVETLDASGDPSGTLWGANTNAAQVIAAVDDNTWFEVTLTAGAVVSRGDRFAVVIVNPGTPGNINICKANFVQYAIPYVDLYTGSWLKNANPPIGAIRYNDATYANIGGLIPASTLTATTFNSGSSPDERGNVITVPIACKTMGVWLRGVAELGDFTVKVYSSTDVLLASKAIDGDAKIATANIGERIMLDTEVTIAAGDIIRVTLLPTTVTDTRITELTCPAGLANALPGGGQMVHTSRVDGGAWTDTANKVAGIGLILSALSDGAGAGGSTAYAFV